MDILVLLRVLTLAARLALAGALAHLLVNRRSSLGRGARRGWAVLAFAAWVVAADNGLLEGLALVRWLRPEAAGLESLHLLLYHLTYLMHAVLPAAVPAALLAILHPDGRWRWAFGVVIALVAVVGGVAVAAGALETWDVLLAYSRVLAFASIGGYLFFWTLLLLGHLGRVDAYLAGFVAVETLFELLLPVQEVFILYIGREDAGRIWHLLQFLQFVMATAQGFIVLALAGALARGRPVRALTVPL